jgi:hypothetical protein
VGLEVTESLDFAELLLLFREPFSAKAVYWHWIPLETHRSQPLASPVHFS